MTTPDDATLTEIAAPKVGGWAVTQDGGLRENYVLIQIDRVTPRLVYGRTGSRRWYRQHKRHQVFAMPSEAAARLFIERATSARSEAARREIAAWQAYRETVAKLIRTHLTGDKS